MSITQFLPASLTGYSRAFEYSSSVSAAKQSESLIHRGYTTVTRLVNSSTPTTLSVCIFLLTVLVMLTYRPFSQAESGDSAFYDYFAQLILRGQIPYRDAIDIKAPGSFYLSALAMAAGRALGVRDIIAARLLHIFMASLLSVIVYLVGEAYFRNRFAALLAVSTLMVSQHFGLWTVGGGQPKLPMILFGMVALLLTVRNHPFLAGLCSMMSCLCWQPGLLFTGVAFLIFSRYLTRWRDLRALKVLAGAAIPLALVVGYFGIRGALGDLWNWTIVFNYSIYSRKALESEVNPLRHMMSVVFKVYRTDIVLIAIALAGFAVFTGQRLRQRLGKTRAPNDLYQGALVIAPLVYFAACLIRFNAGPYLIPFLPFTGLFFGFAVTELLGVVNKRLSLASVIDTKTASLTLILVLLLGVAAYRAIAYQFESIQTLQEQDKTFQAVGTLLSASDRVYVHGTTELLVLLDKPNLNPYVFIDFGKDDYIAVQKYGGSFSSLIEEIEAQAPKVIALSRLQRVSHRNELKEWAETHYVSLGLPGYEEISIRKSEFQTGKPANNVRQ